MRRTTALIVALALSLPLGACSASTARRVAPTASVAPSEVESSPPAAGDTEPDDFRKDISDASVKRPSDAGLRELFVSVAFMITNHGTVPATYEVSFAIYDAAKTQVAAVRVSTEAMGPTRAGSRAAFSDGVVGLASGKLPAGAFTSEIESVDRVTDPTD